MLITIYPLYKPKYGNLTKSRLTIFYASARICLHLKLKRETLTTSQQDLAKPGKEQTYAKFQSAGNPSYLEIRPGPRHRGHAHRRALTLGPRTDSVVDSLQCGNNQ